ncbi:MAG: hypothetical protein GX483_04400 [Actinomycetaceae bacterium]|nr:hypothetical protein [Actinomycetaceae bacterium]
MAAKYRRPAQLTPEQVELIEGDAGTEARMELAHATASALVPLGRQRYEAATKERILEVIEDEGIDGIAETWVDAPENSLPGVLWRGYLLSEWIRRYPEEVAQRYTAAKIIYGEKNADQVALVVTPAILKSMWDEVFDGDFDGDFVDVIRQSARFTHLLSIVTQAWIDDDGHPLATHVTLRDTAMTRTSEDFRRAGEELLSGTLA